MSASAGWYPDPGGGQGLYRYWDGKAWSAATSPYPNAPAPTQGLVRAGAQPTNPSAQPYGSIPGQPPSYGHGAPGFGAGSGQPAGSAYATYSQIQRQRSPIGWWIAGAALVVVLVFVAVIAIRAVSGSTAGTGIPGGQSSQDTCPVPKAQTAEPSTPPPDGRVHGGPVSYPELGSPWGAPAPETRVPFGVDVRSQEVTVQASYQPGKSWVASILVGQLQAGDGFFTPEQGSQIVVKCILGAFYDDNPVTSDVKVNKKATIDGHDAWIVESQLSFDIRGLETKGELLLVAIVADGPTSGLYYASIPDTVPQLVQPARDALKELRVDG